jgi:hypothetical protein
VKNCNEFLSAVYNVEKEDCDCILDNMCHFMVRYIVSCKYY